MCTDIFTFDVLAAYKYSIKPFQSIIMSMLKPDDEQKKGIPTSIVPWLSVRNAVKAIAFYKNAFDAVEVYRLEDGGGGVVVRLSVDGAEFWVSGESSDNEHKEAELMGGDSVRMI